MTVERHFEGLKWNMVCLPFHLDADAIASSFGTGAKLAAFTGSSRTVHNASGAPARRASTNTATGSVEFETTTGGLTANTPYLIYPTADVESITVENKWVSESSPTTVTQGSYSLVGTNTATSVSAGDYYIDEDGEYTQSGGSTGDTVPATGGYFTGSSGSPLEPVK